MLQLDGSLCRHKLIPNFQLKAKKLRRKKKKNIAAPAVSAVKAASLLREQQMEGHSKTAKQSLHGFTISLKEFLQMKQDASAVKQ